MGVPGDTADWLGPVLEKPNESANLAPVIRPPGRDIRWAIFGIIMQAGLTVTRSYVQNVLVFDHGYNPKDVTDALGKLRDGDHDMDGFIRREKLQVGYPEPVHVYTYNREATTEERKRLKELYAIRKLALDTDVVGDAGERYVAAMFERDANYKRNRKYPLGKACTAAGRPTLDLFVTDRDGVLIGVSVKNLFETIFKGHEVIKDVHRRAAENEVVPMLVAPFLNDCAKERCDRDGIRYIELKAQVLPLKSKDRRPIKTTVRYLRPILGPFPFKYQPAVRTR